MGVHSEWQQEQLMEMLKALADENRLALLRLLHEQEITVGELAERIGIGEPTTSHHLSKLREVGLVALRMEGNKRFYRVSESGLATFKRYVQSIEQPPKVEEPLQADDSWIEALGWSQADADILRNYTKQGKLIDIPVRQPKRLVVLLRWLATLFEADRLYTEREVTAIIKHVSHDPVGLRRDLIDYGFLRRERGGGKYWLTPADEQIS